MDESATEVMTSKEAAGFLRFSLSTMHQRRDIPRHTVPGSRQIRYLRSELLAWLKGELTEKSVPETLVAPAGPGQGDSPLIDIATRRVYHRNGRYR
jgi:predicted DNA-binding transcriptional regulator AlpA